MIDRSIREKFIQNVFPNAHRFSRDGERRGGEGKTTREHERAEALNFH